MKTAGDQEHIRITRWQADALSKTLLYHSFELPDGTAVPGLIPVDALRRRIDRFNLPDDLTGMRALDIGAASGWNSFELARRGADVVAVDYVKYPEFEKLADVYNYQIDYRILDMEEMTPDRLGTFDVVLFFGVLYHLRHPLLGLERVCSLSRGMTCVESFVTDPELSRDIALQQTAQLEFYETTELGGQLDNWFGPNQSALVGLCRAAGFVRVEHLYTDDRRAGVICHRIWPRTEPMEGIASPELRAVINNRDSTAQFSPPRDEYLCAYFDSREEDLAPTSVFVEIDGFALPVLSIAKLEGSGWQVNCRCPPWLAHGRHEVRLRTSRAPFSLPVSIYCHEEPPKMRSASLIADAPVITEIGNGLHREAVFHGYKAEYLCCRFELRAAAVGVDDLMLFVDETPVEISAVVPLGANLWQCNAGVPIDLSPGTHTVRLQVYDGGASSLYSIRRV